MAKVEKLSDKKHQPTREELELAAYFRWLDRGCPDGDDLTDWVEVEKYWNGKSVSKGVKKKS